MPKPRPLQVVVTFDERQLHGCLSCKVKFCLGLALRHHLLPWQGPDDRVTGDDLDIGDGEDTDHGVPLALVPVVVDLLLDVDYVALLEGEFALVLGLDILS